MGSKPKVLMAVFDELYGVCSTFVKVVEEHFEIVWMEDFEKDPKNYESIVAILEWLGPVAGF